MDDNHESKHGTSGGCGCRSTSVKAGEEATFTCPMHPEIRQDGPGNCPICHMTLVPVAAAETTADAVEAASCRHSDAVQPVEAVTGATVKYTCPMHPEVRQDGPGTCPKCHMTLVPEGAPVPSSDTKSCCHSASAAVPRLFQRQPVKALPPRLRRAKGPAKP